MKKENQLLSRVLKAVGIGNEAEAKTEEVAKADSTGTDVEAAATETIELAVDTAAAQAELETIKAKLEAVTAEMQENLATANSVIDSLTAKLEEAEATIAKMVGDAHTAKLAARYEKVVAAIGTEKADGLMTATEGLDDAAFEAVVSALVGSVEAEAKTDLFQEVGVTAEADAAKIVEESEEMKLLKQKYPDAK